MAFESDDNHSTDYATELEYFMESPNDSDVEIKVFNQDGTALSAISEHGDDLEAGTLPTHSHDMFNPPHHPSSLYYMMHDAQQPFPIAENRSKRHKIKHMLKNFCEASPHLYIQQRHTGSALLSTHLYLDEYMSFKYFYEVSLPLCVEVLLSFGTCLFNPIGAIAVIAATVVVTQQIQFAVFALLTTLSSFVLFQLGRYFRVLPFRALPNVVRNTDEFGFNVQRGLNVRSLFYGHRDHSHVSSFPDSNACNVVIYTCSCYLLVESCPWLLFALLPYVMCARCYFAFNYVMDCMWSALLGVIFVVCMQFILPSTFLIITEEIVKEVASNVFA